MQLKQFFKLFVRAVKGEDLDYTQGSINRALFMLAVPMILEMLMESLFAIVDVFLVAGVSNEAVATVGMTEGLLMLVESVAIGIAMATTALVARRIGEKDFDQASDVAVQSIILASAVSLVTGFFAFQYAEEILVLMGADQALIAEGKEYTRIILSLNFILMFLFVFNGIFRAAGNPELAMRTLLLANGINIVLDPLFIYGLGPIEGMGITGAAVATCIGRGSGVAYQLYVLFSNSSSIKLYKKHFKPNLEILSKLFRVSLGGAGQFLISTASWIFLIRILASFGSAVLAGYTIAIRIIIFSILPSWGLSNATATLVGQNLGAKKPERAEITVWKAGRYNMIFLLMLSVLFLLAAKQICGFFTNDTTVIREAVLCLMIISTGYIFYAYQMIISQAFNGAGDTATPTKLNFVFMWLIQIPLAYFLSYYTALESRGVYVSISLSSVLLTIVAVYIFRKGNWKKVKV
jgi:putative MATE family efflux protein